MNVTWDPDKLNITGEEVAEIVARSKPRIAIGARSGEGKTSINITPSQMRPGNAKIVAARLHEILSQKRKPIANEMAAAKANLTGHWNVDMEFFTSKSEHHFFLQQDGNWISGSHQSDFATQEIVGMIEGTEIKLRSNHRSTGDGISYWFSARMEGENLTGSVFLGEYLTAKFSAKRTEYKKEHKRIVVPGGPPLAT